MRTAGAAFDPANLDTIAQTTLNVLYYNVFGGTDAEVKLGGVRSAIDCAGYPDPRTICA